MCLLCSPLLQDPLLPLQSQRGHLTLSENNAVRRTDPATDVPYQARDCLQRPL